MKSILKSEGNGASVIIPITSDADIATGSLNGQMVKDMEANEATLKIETKSANYTLPVSEINVDQISQQYGESVALSDIDVEISIAEPSNETVTVVENAAETGDFSIVVPAVDFSVNCYNDGTFGPNDKITREQAMVMIVRAMKKTGLKVELVEDEVTELLSQYSDTATVAPYAKASFATCIKAGIIQGVGTGALAPKEKISRAEVAVMVQRLLQNPN